MTPLPLTPRRARSRTGTAVGRRAEGDAGVAMVTALLSMMVTAMLSLALLGMILSQAVPTQHARASSKAVFAAEAGINAVAGQIRNAKAAPDAVGAVYGDRAKLPCGATGTVESGTAGLTYSATVQYFIDDPTGRSAAWAAANALGCVPGAGPSENPLYALVVSKGIGTGVPGMGPAAGNRTVSAVYTFDVTNTNTPGGLVYSYDAAISPDRFCLEAYSAAAGSYVRYVDASMCGTKDALQLWVYDVDYRIKLASTTVPGAGVDPLCVTGPSGGTLPQRATLQVCAPATSLTRWNQLWSWRGGARWQGENSTITDYSSVHLYSGVTSGSPAGRDLFVGAPGGWDNKEWGSYNPDPRVGAGAAGYTTRQIVNYLEFGRCFDVTHEQVGYSFMIVYPCKQDPSGGSKLFWNHKWYYTEPANMVGSQGPQQIHVLEHDDPAKKYCLRSSGTEGGFVTLTSACSATADNQKWTRYANTGAYATSYTFVDHWGRCASLGEKHQGAYSKIVTSTCTSGLGQKWNAPPSIVSAALEAYREVH